MVNSSLSKCLVLVFLHINLIGLSQGSKLQIKGDQFLHKEKYSQAIEYFSGLKYEVKQKEPIYNYYIGISYYKMPDGKEASIDYLESYLKESDSLQRDYLDHDKVFYILGKMYHLTNDFTKAKEYYTNYIKHVSARMLMSDEEKEEIVISVKREIEQCNFGEIAILNPRNVYIENLGDEINTIYPDYASVVSQDEKILIFTSRRPEDKKAKSVSGDNYKEDMYSAELIKGSLFEKTIKSQDSSKGVGSALITEFEYENFQKMGEKFNTAGHDAGIQLGPKDEVLYFYRDSDIWKSKLKDSTNSDPDKMGENINSKGQEASIFFSYNGKKLFIASDREGGFGGLDLYMSEKQDDGAWGDAVNLGPNINTEYDEDAPYLDPDDKTLYFSSTGNSSIGGYDIFRSKHIDTTWSYPINLGYPINTTSDDIYFSMTSIYNRGYYSSGKLEGRGDMDLYRITFVDERDPVAELVGLVKLSDNSATTNTLIEITSVDGVERITNVADSITGSYFLLLGHGKEYDMNIKTTNYAPFQRRFEVPEQKEYFQLYQEVHQEKIYDKNKNEIGQKITVYNMMGDQDSSVVLYDSLTLMALDLMKMNLNYQGNIDALTDVKFYITEDSLKSLMADDTSLFFMFDANTNVSFKIPENDKYEIESYNSFNVSLNRDKFVKNGIRIEDGSSIEVAKAENVNRIEGLFYTVQIGVYANPVTPEILMNIQPLNSQITDKGYIRYTSGRFKSIESAGVKMDKMVSSGVPDAYITAYYNGERITIANSRSLIEENGESILIKVEE